ncbi:MAG: hypothetical protein U1E29_03645 [Coriobacteriia bacterium]|jgi:hypothetical protein|nr:hypothetical protein [Coriobacteriia bacterium]
MDSFRERVSVSVVLILPLTWLAAGIANFGLSIYGNTPSVVGIIATFLAIAAWPVAGLAAGRFLRTALFVRLALGFWAVVSCAPVVYLLTLDAVPPQGLAYGLVLMLMGILVLPLYGLTAVLPSWEPVVRAIVIDGAVAQTLIIGPVVLASSVAAFVAGRRIRDSKNALPSDGRYTR